MYYIIYKTTNKVNGKIYIGVHQTDDIDDSYMGSGMVLMKAIKKYGIECFKKQVLKVFDNPKDMFKMESVLVNEEFVKRIDTYNIKKGGYGGWDHLKDTVNVKDENGNGFSVDKNDPRYLSGELKSTSCGRIIVRDINDNVFNIKINDKRYLSGELKSVACGFLNVKDKNGNMFHVNIDDPRYLSGELKHVWCGKKHTEESKRKIGQANAIHQKGSSNSQYGTCWIYNHELKQSKKIKKEMLNEWLDKGWIKGRKIKFS